MHTNRHEEAGVSGRRGCCVTAGCQEVLPCEWRRMGRSWCLLIGGLCRARVGDEGKLYMNMWHVWDWACFETPKATWWVGLVFASEVP